MKTIITTAAQASDTKHEDGVCFLCSDCQKTNPVQTSGGTGYACTKEGAIICYACADKRQVEDLKDRSKPFVGYLTFATVTTWTGGLLMRVIRSAPCKLTRPSFTHDRNSFRSIRARDVHGKDWHGRGSVGIAIILRPCK